MSTRRRHGGFTLIEMLAVMALMGLVISFTVNFYIQLSRESNSAADRSRETRRGTAVLDRVARDIEGSFLVVKPGEVDPLDHPWLFYAEVDSSDLGADRIKFDTRNHQPRSDHAHESDVNVVAYVLDDDAEGHKRLLRWSSPRLPQGLDRSLPLGEDDGALLLADDVADFGVRFQDETGAWRDTWDSSSLVDASRLPVAAEIRVVMRASGGGFDDAEPAAGEVLARQILIPQRPIDLEVLLDPQRLAGGGSAADDEEDAENQDADDEEGSADDGATADAADEDGPCTTINVCIARHPEVDVNAMLQEAGLTRLQLRLFGNQCARDVSSFFPVPGDCL